MLKIGDKMPDFSVANQNGEIVSSGEFIGKKTVVYFYPKDNTSGCTAEACNLRDNYRAFVDKGYNIVGVSKDSVASHKKFAEKYDLPFTLLADTSTEMIQAFGAWGQKKMYGRDYMGIMRYTYIFDENGILIDIIEKVDTKNHSAQILG
ncbi:MAG: thioredoxin-dependent thiol peroxidase [Bacteroidaceae bacterium]|nr:thioredoxin-dependent thiol peroxidase [Bacteroidaceae bacterium]